MNSIQRQIQPLNPRMGFNVISIEIQPLNQLNPQIGFNVNSIKPSNRIQDSTIKPSNKIQCEFH